jgi:hypothetical protein
MEIWSRRKFFITSLAGSAIAGANKLFGRDTTSGNATAPSGVENAAQGKRPLIISSANGLHALDRGMDILKKGGDTLDAVVAAVTVVEDDPNDDSVGFGGLPNEEGEVELDASCMHGPTRRAGSVASVRRIKNVSRLAKTVMERTNHVMIVGEGAHRFAIDQGFEDLNLLTERSRLAWLAWKASTSFNWRPGIDSPDYVQKSSIEGYNQQIAAIFDTPEKRAWLRQGRHFRDHHNLGTGLENSGPRWRLTDRRRGMFRGQRSRCRGFYWKRRGEHQNFRRPHHRGNDASRQVSLRRVPRSHEPRGAQLQKR